MTKIELIDAYVRGEIDRRGFISKLAALGVSATAAAAYAGSLAPGASAASHTQSAGFVMRAQIDWDEYGAEFLEALIQTIIAIIRSILEQIFSNVSMDDFRAAGLSTQDIAQLQAARSQIEEQAHALDAHFGTAKTSQPRAEVSGTLAEQLSALAAEYNRYASVLARMAPAAEQAEQRELLTAVGFAASRQAALTNRVAGHDPAPYAIEPTIDLSTV